MFSIFKSRDEGDVTAADVLVDTLVEWGVDVVFGLPGDGINGIMESLRRQRDRIRFVQVRHEEAAAFMACGYAKFTGRLGVCLATSGPGGLHLLNGLYDAKLDGQPVLAITGHHFHDLIDTHAQQDVNLDRIFSDVAVYNTRVMGPAHVANVANLACRVALARRGVSHINFPVDLQDATLDKGLRSKRNIARHNTDVFAHAAGEPVDADLDRAAKVLNGCRRVAILAGRGAIGAADELEAAAERLGAPIIKALLGKSAVADTSPYTTGGIGLLGTRPSQEAMENCDGLLIVGSSFPYMEFMPQPDQARGVQIDLDATRIGLRYPVEVGLVGDSRRTLQRLLPRLQPDRRRRRFLTAAQDGMKKWRALMEERSHRSDLPMKPQVVARAVSEALTDDAIVSCDSGTVATWWARHIDARPGQLHSLSGTLATMAPGLPYAIAAQVAHPGRQCVAFVGDGALTMLMGELATCVKYQLPVKIVVIKNNTLGQIKWEQMVFLGNPEYGCELEPIDFAGVAKACGVPAYHVEDPMECGDVVRRAFAAPGPALIEAVVDPYEPPMPAKISAGQAKKLGESLVKGTPNRERIAITIAEDRIRELV
ncbi:MAG: thiamine pyrophosphate-dependent enzyme [Vicinamibacterales bacterium]